MANCPSSSKCSGFRAQIFAPSSLHRFSIGESNSTTLTFKKLWTNLDVYFGSLSSWKIQRLSKAALAVDFFTLSSFFSWSHVPEKGCLCLKQRKSPTAFSAQHHVSLWELFSRDWRPLNSFAKQKQHPCAQTAQVWSQRTDSQNSTPYFKCSQANDKSGFHVFLCEQ